MQPNKDAGMGSFQEEGSSKCKGLGVERRPVHLRNRRKGSDWLMISEGEDGLGRGKKKKSPFFKFSSNCSGRFLLHHITRTNLSFQKTTLPGKRRWCAGAEDRYDSHRAVSFSLRYLVCV